MKKERRKEGGSNRTLIKEGCVISKRLERATKKSPNAESIQLQKKKNRRNMRTLLEGALKREKK